MADEPFISVQRPGDQDQSQPSFQQAQEPVRPREAKVTRSFTFGDGVFEGYKVEDTPTKYLRWLINNRDIGSEAEAVIRRELARRGE